MDVDQSSSPRRPPSSTPGYLDPESSRLREEYRRYRKRLSSSNDSPLLGTSVSRFSEARVLHDGSSMPRRPNAGLLLEEIKQEAADYSDIDGFDGSKLFGSAKRRTSLDGGSAPDAGFVSGRKPVRSSMNPVKMEGDMLQQGETTFTVFASLLDSAIQGLMPFPDVILQFERTCRNASESIRYAATGKLRMAEDKLMQQKAQLLLDEAASWSLLWYLYGKANEELPGELFVSPTTSHQEACRYVATDLTAQLCLRIVLWLEGLASEALDLEKKVRGSHVGSYLPSSGVWHRTQRYLKRKNNDSNIVKHVDFDAPTREGAQLLPDDKKQDELLLEDIWTLLRAGRLEEACELCRSAGQAWRAATLCPFGGVDMFPSLEAMLSNGQARTLQAIELESGIGRQWRLWKWASYCASEKIAEHDGGRYEMAVYAIQCSNLKRTLPICTDWESACWAMAKSWLDVQVDLELSQYHTSRQEEKQYDDDMNGTQPMLSSVGPENWPYLVLDQQPRDITALLQKLHSSDLVHETVSRACREQHRQIEMNLMSGNVAHLLDLLWSWISPSEEDQNVSSPLRSRDDPEMIRFGAHIVLVMRYLFSEEMEDELEEKLVTVGDLIINMYVRYLFSEQQEELVGVYASQLERDVCIDLFVEMMELRLNSSLHTMYKLFLSAVEYLPFSSGDVSKACFEEIIERVLSRSRETKPNKYNEDFSDVAERHHVQALHKAMVIQWLCFTPPSSIPGFQMITGKLLMRALMHSNTLFREFSLISMRRGSELPIGPHKLLAILAEPLKQKENFSLEDQEISDNLQEFEDWHEYYSLDATYRGWLRCEMENSSVPPDMLSAEEKDQAVAAATQTLELAFLLLLREERPWLNAVEISPFESSELVFLELHATAILCLPSGECMPPDATSCTALTSALYSTVSEEEVLHRQLKVDVKVSSKDPCCIEVALRCLATEGDGFGLHEANDGGLLAAIMAAGFKGELNRFQPGVSMEISRLDAWYSDGHGSVESTAAYIIRGLCRRCCLPETILRSMQASISLSEAGDSLDHCDKLIELVASSDSGMIHLFSQQQIQEFLIFERECFICKMELEEEQIPTDG
ncbi:nuclear pore complex protein NUP107 isoform X1 [Lolium perenne]|uniref:nuclear pore complex protein NUP107 isoform X1 n=1 Tax=Lolium perenne TaxID=4522 RepID=UPI0021F67F57|nr:nuclear pore complex protein NUP107 isoform X1 [Lolium perenne]